MPSIGQPYTVTVLPATLGHKSSGSKRQRRDSVNNKNESLSVSISCKSSRVTVGIDKSGILAFHLRPSLRPLETIALSPVSRVVSVSPPDPYTVFSSSILPGSIDNSTKKRRRIYACIEERGLIELRCFETSKQPNDKESSSETFTRQIDTLAQYIFPVQDRAHGEFVIVASTSCLLKAYSHDFETELWTLKPKASRSLLFAHFVTTTTPNKATDGLIATANALQTNHTVSQGHGFLVLVARRDVGKKSILEVRTIAVGYSPQDTFEVSVFEIEIQSHDDDSLFAFTESSTILYRLAPHNLTLTCYDVCTGRLAREPQKFKLDHDDQGSISFVAVGDNNLLLSLNNQLCFIDVKFGSLVAQLSVPRQLKLLTSMGSTVLAISMDNGVNEVQALSIDTGSGNLFESLGKACCTETSDENNWDLSFTQLPMPKSLGMSLNEYNSQFAVKLEAARQENKAIIKQLNELSKANKTSEFQDAAFKLFCPQDDAKDNSTSFRVYDGDRDHAVDYGVMVAVVNMIFRHKNGKDVCLSKDFLPERLVVYLLTHPLFPTPELDGLINALSPYPRLVRQALVTCPSLSLQEIIGSGLKHSDDGVFIDAVNRLVEEFSLQLTGKELWICLSTSGQDVKQQVDRMVKLRIGWEIMACFLDAGGILGWDKDTVDELTRRVQQEIKTLEAEQVFLTLVNESVRKFSTTSSGGGGRHKGSKILQQQQPPQVMVASDAKLQSALRLENGGVNVGPATGEERRKQLVRRGQAISRKVQTYSVEKLVL